MQFKNFFIIGFLYSVSSLSPSEIVSELMQTNYLAFTINQEYRIKGFNKFGNMEFFFDNPADFVGKIIYDSIPLSIDEKDQMKATLQLAAMMNIMTARQYTITKNGKSESFIALITPLKKLKDEKEINHFYIKVTKQ